MEFESPWIFSMELLPHVHTLRIFLLPRTKIATDRVDVAASLLSAPPMLFCTLYEVPHRHGTIHLPLPLLLYDYSAPPRARLQCDCIEITINLLPLGFSSFSIIESQPGNGRSRLQDDVKADNGHVSSLEGPPDHPTHETADLFCRNCSTKVSRNPLREFIHMPYAGWRDVVENWFGACCCSFGSKAESLSKRFEKSLNLRPGGCLLGLSTCYISFSDTVVSAELIINDMDGNNCKQMGSDMPVLGDGFMVSENEYSKLSKWKGVHCISCRSLIGGYACKMASSDCWTMEGLHIFQFQIKADGFFRDMFRYATLESLFVKSLRLRTEEETSYKFLIRSLTSEVPLLQLVILSCDSLISTGSVSLSSAVEAASKSVQHADSGDYHASQSSCDSGHLKRVMKVMFSDCSKFSADEMRSKESWAKQQEAEIIYMFDELVERLTNELHNNSVSFPVSCRFSDVFKCSFLCIEMSDQSYSGLFNMG